MMSNKSYTFLDKTQTPYLFCPGCGHGKIIDHLNTALERLAIKPEKLVIITDIGCAGLSDRYFLTNAFHGLHGRSITYATGIKLANPELRPIVLIGDGGCGIGGHHLLNAARRNIGVTTIVFNNLNYGMTGGEHSVTTPTGSFTATTPLGQLEQPMDICGTVMINGASFVARTTAFDSSLPDLITKAVNNNGFSLIDIWELCTAHFASKNQFGKKELHRTLDALSFPTGILEKNPRPEFSTAYRKKHHEVLNQKHQISKDIPTNYHYQISQPLKVVLAGAAGGKIGSAASIFAEAAIRSGLWASQRNDYPVTVKSGHSLSEIIISPQPQSYTAIDKPDVVFAIFPEGLEKIMSTITRLSDSDLLIISNDLSDIRTRAVVVPLDFRGFKKEQRAIISFTTWLKHNEVFPLDAFREAINSRPGYEQENLAAFNAGLSLYYNIL